MFILFFVKHPALLKHLVAQLLQVPLSGITQFEIKNLEMPPDIIGSKFFRLDIRMEVNGQQCNLEVQMLSNISDKGILSLLLKPCQKWQVLVGDAALGVPRRIGM